MAQLYDEPILEISLDKDMNTSFVPDSEPSKEDPLHALLQMANGSKEPMGTDMLPNLPS